MSDQVTPAPAVEPEPGQAARRLLVVASDPRSADPVLGLDFRDAAIVAPQADQSLPTDTDSRFDDIVIADFEGDPAVLAARLAHAVAHVEGDATVSVALTADIGAVNGASDSDAWAKALSGYRADAFDADGHVLLLRPAEGPDASTGPIVLGALRAASAARAARRAELAARPVARSATDRSPAADASNDEEPALTREELEAENLKLARRVKQLERSTAVRASRRLRALRRGGARTALKRLRPRERAVLAAGALVGLLLFVGTVAVLTASTDSFWLALVVTLVAVVVVLGAIRGELSRQLTARKLRVIDNRVAATQRKQFVALKRIAARTRAHHTLMGSLDRRFATTVAAHHDTADTVAAMAEDLRKAQPERVRRAVATDSTKQYEQLQAAMNLFALVDVTAPVPPMRGWAVSPDALLVLVGELLTRRPAVVLECGSGSSTLWTALAIRKFGLPTRIVSLDHQAEYKAATEATLERHGVADLADVRLAPLVPTGIPGHTTPWYDVSVVSDVRGVGLLFVDGPPESSGALARYPALPLLGPTLDDDVVVVLDDAMRADEKTAVERWLAEDPRLTTEYLRTEKGTSILRRSSGPTPPSA